MSKETFVKTYDFRGPLTPAAIASVDDGPWASKDTSAAGSPTIAAVSGGLMQLTLDNTSEVQNLCLYQGDILPFVATQLEMLEVWASITASLDSHVSAAFGLAGARNDAIASITNRCLFKLSGSNTVLCETADGTNSAANKSTGLTLSTTVRRFVVEFKQGVNSVSGGLSTGGLSNILFSMENSSGQLVRVCESTRFDMSALTSSNNLQLFAQLQKTADTAVATLSLRRFRVTWRE